jgi:hypothetical protein
LLDFIETHTVGKNGVVTYKPGVLHVFVAKHRGSEAIHSAEVEISNDTIEVYLATDEDGMCKKKLPGGNYTVTATHREKNESQRITVDGKTDLSLYIK